MDKENTTENRQTILPIVGFLCLIVAGILLLLYFMNGKTTSESGGTVEKTESITCESSKLVYPFFSQDNATQRKLKIDAVLDDNKLATIFLSYKLYPDDKATVEKTTTNLTIAVKKSFAADGLSHEALGSTFSSLTDSSQMTLYAEAKELSGTTAKYFLLETANGNYNKETLTKVYTEQGLSCSVKE